MFDIAFSELLIIALVALIVIGPERLPGMARTAGQWWGRLQRYVNNVKRDIASDMAAGEVRKLQESVELQVADVERTLQETELTLQQHILQARYKDAKPGDTGPATPTPPKTPE